MHVKWQEEIFPGTAGPVECCGGLWMRGPDDIK